MVMNVMSNRNGGEPIEDKIFISDFEKGITGAAREVFEDAEIYGCLFLFPGGKEHFKFLGINF